MDASITFAMVVACADNKVTITMSGKQRVVDVGSIITVYEEEEDSGVREDIESSSAKSAFSTLSSSSVDEIENGLETVWRRYKKKKGGKLDRSCKQHQHQHQLTKKELNQLEPDVAEVSYSSCGPMDFSICNLFD